MFIRKLQIQNYKSFANATEIPLERGFNLIVGQNDAGKSALLEALQPGMEFKAHRSLPTAPEMGTPAVPYSKSTKEFSLTASDIRGYLSQYQNLSVSSGGVDHASAASALVYFQNVLAHDGILTATWHDHNFAHAEMIPPGDTGYPLQFRNAAWPYDVDLRDYAGNGGEPFTSTLARQIGLDIYAFKAERYKTGSGPAGGGRILASDASNLPEVLNKLADDPATERELLDHVRAVFPHITHVSSALENGTTAHVKIWTYPVASKRRDLAIPLADSGSGIGQVLAMLYVAVTAERPKVILIDEPQSFLHPGAVRKLFEILSNYSQHQYVITTHAPGGLNITAATNLLLVRRGEDCSTVVRLDSSTQEGVGAFLTEVGARLSDVFGADNVLWVEGKTEERCFPILVRDVAKRKLGGTQIVGVVNTGDLEAEFADRVITIYQRLTSGASVLPPAIAFLFDREGRSEQKREDIARRAHGLMKWLPRRMFENYLINSWAISEVINAEDFSRASIIRPEDVDAWFDEHGCEKVYFPRGKHVITRTSPLWVENVHAGKMLKTLFDSLSDRRVSYDKVKHGEQLTRLLAQRPTREITELAMFIAKLCGT